MIHLAKVEKGVIFESGSMGRDLEYLAMIHGDSSIK